MSLDVLYAPSIKEIGGILLAYPPTGRCCVIIDENASKEEALDTIKWARETLESGVTTEQHREACKALVEILGVDTVKDIFELDRKGCVINC